jgi:hypothetical protein
LKEPQQEFRGRPSKQLFQLRCGMCGGSFTVANAHKLGCSKHLNSKGTGCTNKTLANTKLTNAALIDLVKKAVLSPEMVAVFAAEASAEAARVSAQPKATAASIKRKLATAEKEIANLIDAIASYGLKNNPDVQRRLKSAPRLEIRRGWKSTGSGYRRHPIGGDHGHGGRSIGRAG